MSYLTENQKKAHDVNRHLSVIANAGSGKTTVLVERYVDIIQYGHATAHEVIALTFTEKAAGELRQRIADTIHRRYEEAEDLHERYRLEILREQLSSAIIGTIHSFCARLLREYPVDVPTSRPDLIGTGGGIDASFTILEVVDQQSLIGEAANEVFQAILGTPEHPHRKELLHVVRMLGRNAVVNIIHYLLSKREIAEHFIREYSRPDDEILSEWNTVVDHYVDEILLAQSLNEAFQELTNRIQQKKKREIQSALDAFLSANSMNSRLDSFSLLWRLFLRNDYHLRSGIFDVKNIEEQCHRSLAAIQSAASAVRPLIEGMAGRDDAHRLLLASSRTFLSVFQEILTTYNRRKAENAQLDFEDLQIYVKALLSKSEIRQKLSKTYTYIMVDEFQDTNRLQYEILLSLVETFAWGNLFVVGDPKQSIYGFRNAEVEIFMHTIDDIAAHAHRPEPFFWHGTILQSTPLERAGNVTLAESFRLLPSIAAFVNMIFTKCMDQARNKFSVPYTPLIVARTTSAPGRVELLLPSNRIKNPEEMKVETSLYGIEEEMIARRILSLHRDEYTIIDKRSEEPRPIKFGDIAILLRSRTNLHRLEQALLHYHVPYIIYSGGGFYQTQELYDFFNYFQFFLNPHDDTALAGILRSPFFACSDASLYRVSLVEEGTDFWSKACAWTARHPDADRHMTRAVDILRGDLLRAGRQSLSDCILEVILRTGYNGVAAASHRSAQHTANVKKLLQIARSFEVRGFSNQYDFVERLRVLIEEEEQEGQASIDETENAIHVMTIHAAKGLEFGAVIVPYLQKDFHYDSEPFIDMKGYIGYTVVQPADFDKEFPVPLTEILRQRSRRKTEAEEQRIFYVACTRARDLLVLSGTTSQRSRPMAALTWVQEGLGIDSPEERGRTTKEVTLQRLILHDGAYESIENKFPLTVEWFCRPDEFPVVISLSHGQTLFGEFPLANVQSIPSGEEGEYFSATQIKTYHDCPLKYHLLYHLGMAEIRRESYHYSDEDEEDTEPLSATTYGTLIHRVLQKVLSQESMTHLSLFLEEAVAEQGLSGNRNILDTVGRAEREITSFCSSDTGRRVLSADQIFTEYRLDGKLGNDFITGTIDRLVQINGIWEVIDYKTDSMNGISPASKIQAYRYQIMVYAWLVSRYTSQIDIPVTLYFTDLPGAVSTVLIRKSEIDRFEEEMGRIIGNLRGDRFSKNLTHCLECSFSRNGSCIWE
ncbi:MAG: UvrD-helicase domain-containing protein [Bacteroidota bacterium]